MAETGLPSRARGQDEDGESRTDVAVGTILGRIVRLELRPGASFSESEMTAQLGMSKTPVREALAVLRSQGWVSAEPRSGYRVSPVTLREAQDLFALWLLLEPEAAAGAARHLAEHPGEVPVFVEWLDPQVRRLRGRWSCSPIAAVAGNAELAAMLDAVLLKLQRYAAAASQLRGHPIPLDEDYQPVLDAIRSGEPELAGARARERAESVRQRVLAALLNSSAIQSTNLFDQLRSSSIPHCGQSRMMP
jgi:DNA-binding GntR family transcriptional regulator